LPGRGRRPSRECCAFTECPLSGCAYAGRMVSLRFRTRRAAASPPAFYEPTPYCDRLTLAEGFTEDRETRANAEDRRADHKPVGDCVEAFIEVVAPPARAHRRR
jgi:hypothetical protein